MRWNLVVLAGIVALAGVAGMAAAEEVYWYAPMPNYLESYSPTPATLVGTSTSTTIAGTMDVQFGSTGTPVTVAVPAGGSGQFTTPDDYYYNGIYPDGGYKVTGTDNVVVTYFLPINSDVYTNDAGRILPQNALGTDHYVTTFHPGFFDTFIAIVATEDGTQVQVEPSISVPAGSGSPAMTSVLPGLVTLNDYDVWMVRASGDLSGSRVTSDKPIAVYAGHQCAVIGNSACDHISDQMMPVTLAGTEYAYCSTVPDRSGGTGFDLIRVTSVSSAPTTVTLSPVPSGATSPINLPAAGDWAEFKTDIDLIISSDNDIQVTVFFGKLWSGSNDGDPAMVQLTPSNRFSITRAFYVPPTWDLELTVSLPTGSPVTLDGVAMTASRVIPGSGFSCAHTPLTDGTHYLASLGGVSASVWATEYFASFWYEAGGAILPTVRWGYDNSANTCEDSAVRFFEDNTELPPGRKIVSAGWDFGDGTAATGLQVNHTYAAPGIYKVTFTIVDDRGTKGKVSKDVWAPGDPNCPPKFTRTYERSIYAQRTMRHCVAAEDFEGDDLAFEILPPSPPGLVFANRFCLSWTPTVDQVGDWGPLTIRVRDGNGESTTTIIIHVLPLDPAAPDKDMDGIADLQDNCPDVANNGQEDTDLDGIGDACQSLYGPDGTPLRPGGPRPGEIDRDGDGVVDVADNCASTANPAQTDADGDRLGDACDLDGDGDGIVEASADARTLLDNCPMASNPDQADADGDGAGDACDTTPKAAIANANAEQELTGGEPRDAPLPAFLALVAIGFLALRRRRAA